MANNHIDYIEAEEQKSVKLIALAIFIFGTIGTFALIFPYLTRFADPSTAAGLLGLVAVPFFIYQGINSSHSSNVRYFNLKKYG